MANLAIKGNGENGDKVIALLEMLGGNNRYAFETGFNINNLYYIDYNDCNYIKTDEYYSDDDYEDFITILTLEEYYEKFPFKIGDDVKAFGCPAEITDMTWDKSINEVVYYIKMKSSYYRTTKIARQLQLVSISKKECTEDFDDEISAEYITIGELRKMLEPYSDNDLITVTKGNSSPNYKIINIEDSTMCGFFELRIE